MDSHEISSAVRLSTQARSQAPVFVVGSARSGNTLLYHTLLASGRFANYRGEPAVFDLIGPKFGNLASRFNRERLLSTWLRSEMFRVSGLEKNFIRDRILHACRSRGDFLRIVMDEVARSQGLERWAVWGPDNLVHIRSIKEEVPEALFIHIIRDGRDVALSMCREGWIRPFPWDRNKRLLVAALHWKWKVEHGLQNGRRLGPDYLEVRYEDLVIDSQETLTQIGRFIAQDLDASRIQKRPLGTLSVPNTTFQEEVQRNAFRPVERWRRLLTAAELQTLESNIGPLLEHLGYKLENATIPQFFAQEFLARTMYPQYFELKRWLKLHTVLGRMTSVERLHLS
jgi:Sulfotransferase family